MREKRGMTLKRRIRTAVENLASLFFYIKLYYLTHLHEEDHHRTNQQPCRIYRHFDLIVRAGRHTPREEQERGFNPRCQDLSCKHEITTYPRTYVPGGRSICLSKQIQKYSFI